MSIAAILGELEVETATTRRVLERVPTDKLSWKPHPKSMSLGELALHVAMSPGVHRRRLVLSGHDRLRQGWWKNAGACVDAGNSDGARRGREEDEDRARKDRRRGVASAVDGHDERRDGVQYAEERAGTNDRAQPHLPSPGQLSVYLRLLDVAVPSIYGPSADESPFATAQA